MIVSSGGAEWVRMCMSRWGGTTESGREKIAQHGAVDVYAAFFEKESVVRASCDDYRAGAEEDVLLQEDDQRQGRKVAVPTLLVYSSKYLGKRYDVKSVWKEWVREGTRIETVGIEEVGHFVAEEAPEQTTEAMMRFYRSLV